jgi:hypothetical protein
MDNCVIPGCLNKRLKYDAYCTSYHATYDEDCSNAIKSGLSLVDEKWGPPWPAHLKSSISKDMNNKDWSDMTARATSPDLTELMTLSCNTTQEAPAVTLSQSREQHAQTKISNMHDINCLVSFVGSTLSPTSKVKRKSTHSARNQLELETRSKDEKGLASSSSVRSQSSSVYSSESGRDEGVVYNAKRGRVEKRSLPLTTRKFKQKVQTPITFFTRPT